MISWNTAPKYEYKRYVYRPEIIEYDDGVRKAMHDVYVKGNEYKMRLPIHTIDASPYKFLSYDEFTYPVDVMFLNVYGS